MKIEEAIEVLKGKRECFDTEGLNCWTTNRDCRECEKAVDMAIEALKDIQNCVHCEHYTEVETDTGIQGECKMDTAHRADLISRQDAIDALMNDSDWADAIPTIKSLPSAEPKTGEWKGGDIPNECSVCGAYWDDYVYGQEIWYTGELPNFCPNCGAKMEREK